MDCVMLSLRSKSVSFFFNQDEHICRWDCVFLASRSCTTYCTEPWSYYAIKWKTNEALSRPATSSSVYGGDTMKWGPVYATNGARSPTGTNIFHSQPETSPWLKVHLIGSKMITFVRVYNRRDAVGERFHDVAVEVSPDESELHSISTVHFTIGTIGYHHDTHTTQFSMNLTTRTDFLKTKYVTR
uniref:Uncharacterized protein LOC111109769 isoform X2 n=1 Tax=Crassostrea virginica TaxID=6565 RepID=A0A8B8BFY9_CRAVI|nr:uncharacterized protein LOC111109769 isoform X2 [Crassostrea virginica]